MMNILSIAEKVNFLIGLSEQDWREIKFGIICF